MKRLKIIKIPL